MMYVKYFIIFIAVLSFISCSENSVIESQFSDLIGNVILRDNRYYTSSNSENITVQIERTPYSSKTDDSGNYQLRNIPNGTYVLNFSKVGFSYYKLFNISLVGPGTKYLTENPVELIKLPTDSVTDLRVTWNDTSSFYLSCNRSSPQTRVLFVLYSNEDVSNSTYMYATQGGSNVNIYLYNLRNYGFKNGMNVYIIAYPYISLEYGYYFDHAMQRLVYTAVGEKSNLTSVYMP